MYVFAMGATEVERERALERACRAHPDADGCAWFRKRQSNQMLGVIAAAAAAYWFATRR